MFYKKFRNGLDLRGNGIINSYVENPTTDNQIANKIYVDISNRFDTVNATTKPISTKFPWMVNYANLPLKEVLDKLLFPTVNPEYKNPTLQSYKIFNFGETSNVVGGNINGRLLYNISESSRTPTLQYKLIIKYQNNNELTFTDTNSVGYINFNFAWNNIQSIKLKQIFTPAPIENDSDGNPYVDSNFSTTYDFEYSFNLIEFENIFVITKGLYSKLEITETNLPTYINATGTELLVLMNFGNNITLINQQPTDLTNHNNTLLLIHETLINKFCDLTFKINNKTISSLSKPISKYLLYNTSNELYNVNINNEKYYFGLIDLGKYSTIVNVLISF